MGKGLIGIVVIFMGIFQIYTARKSYDSIKTNVKNQQPYMFYGIYFSLIIGIVFLVVGAFLIK
ncbi:hypothetical protein LCR01_15170 [Companilactobacillus crustorum]|uniref:Immunity protein n=3 Tax=Companilactobacillus TaxID=2767879 RepID=A0A837RI31_9LACO|nr:hypothetical protein [Companilactobacillus crustorum]HCD08330.1 hypothetical protein [Lactobacillus sp.]KRK41868.1 hypothetical protein FD26_GL001029 [Companilactobacillus crustorum JCM 15951]KRO19656.1 hypothetical protein IV63_GL001255 [Companilactobacillus crustorum]WDT65521.1 hypothetical protein NV391_11245 [Companilactobacillus crustorum]GEO77074.1 hypothetical protein LCR01_15170 [Companilactobacillus crustorum]